MSEAKEYTRAGSEDDRDEDEEDVDESVRLLIAISTALSIWTFQLTRE